MVTKQDVIKAVESAGWRKIEDSDFTEYDNYPYKTKIISVNDFSLLAILKVGAVIEIHFEDISFVFFGNNNSIHIVLAHGGAVSF